VLFMKECRACALYSCLRGDISRLCRGEEASFYYDAKTQKVEEWLDSLRGAWVRVVKSGKKWK